MDLSTRYLGLELANPFMPGASPLTEEFDTSLQLEDAGAAALVLPSLFEEDIHEHGVAPDRYLDHLVHLKRRVHIPVIASLNGTTAEGWLNYARMIERGGADALELNFYHVATALEESAATVERRIIDIVAVLKESISIPLAVKLSPFYSALPNLAAQLDRIGADGLVLFNRFYEPDIDPARREMALRIAPSTSAELLLRLRWISILSGRVQASIAVSGGVHEGGDAVKAVMAGADAVQVVSALLAHGPGHLAQLRRAFERWGDEHGCASIGDIRGCLALNRGANPEAVGRGNYVRILQSRSAS